MRVFILISIVLFPAICFSQVQPLSRNDSALIEKYQSQFRAELGKKDYKEASRFLNETAFIYWEHNQNDSAIEYYERSLLLNENLGNENGVAMLHNNLGMLYSDIRNFEQALLHFDKTLAARRAEKKTQSIISALINRSLILNNLEKYQESAEGLEEALSLARKTNDLTQMRSCYGMLSETYEKAGNVEESLHYFRLYQSFHEILQKGEIEKLQTEVEEEKFLKSLAEAKSKINEEELQFRQQELEKVEEEISQYDSLNQSLLDNLTNSQLQLEVVRTKAEVDSLKAVEERNQSLAIIQKERSFRNMMLIVAISLILVVFFIIRNFYQVKRSQKLLAEKNHQIASKNEQLGELNRIIQKQNKRMLSELNVGREIQLGMLPNDFDRVTKKSSIDIFATIEPALEVGGDLYDFFMIDESHLCFCVGDVSDKGVPAALLMAVTKTLIKANAGYSRDPQKILYQVNNEISHDNEASMFVTLFLCVLNIETGELRFTNAGHNPPIIRHSSGETTLLQEIHGPVVGALEGISYKQASLQLFAGDQLTLYTDGVTEAMDHDRNLYSDETIYFH